MICPYICDIQQVNENVYEYSDSGNCTYHEHKLIEKKFPMECKKEKCALWADGKCKYISLGG